MDVKNKENEEAEDEIVEETITSEGFHILSLKLLPLVRNLQSKHGLRHGDYQRYRGYCSRRLARLRKVLKLVQVRNAMMYLILNNIFMYTDSGSGCPLINVK